MLNHSGPCHFGPKVVFIWFFYNICPYTPFKGKWGSGSISWHVETFVVRKLAYLNIWSFSAKMLNHSGPCHFCPKVVFIWIFYNICPYTPFKGRWGSGSISWHVETFYCEETSPFKYLKFFSQNAEPLRPLPFRPKSGVYLIFYNICPYTPFKGKWELTSISWHVETFIVRKLAHLNIWSFSAKMLNHSGPCNFGPKVVFIWFFTISAPIPLSKANESWRSISWHVETFIVRKPAYLNIWSFSAKMLNHSGLCHLPFAPTPPFKGKWGSRYVDLMACRDFCCEETKPI